jgi:hypothetical protein
MEFLNFNGFNFTLLKDRQGYPWSMVGGKIA